MNIKYPTSQELNYILMFVIAIMFATQLYILPTVSKLEVEKINQAAEWITNACDPDC